MSELAKRVLYPDFNHYLLALVGPCHCMLLQQAYQDYPFLAGNWVDLSEFTQYDLDEIDAYLRKRGIQWHVAEVAKNIPEYDCDVV